jgi:menaquinone-dependent protoporphyrinogen oxidase
MSKKVLVAYATKCGSTAEIAEAVAEQLREMRAEADARPAKSVSDLDAYDAVALGSAIRMGRPLREARRFVRKHRRALAQRPVAYFSVSGTMKEDTPENRETAEQHLAALVQSVDPVLVGYFGGCIEISKLEPVFRFMFSRSEDEGMVEGDYRDWDALRAWVVELALALGVA